MPIPELQDDLAKMQLDLAESQKETIQIRREIDQLQEAERNRLHAHQNEQIKDIEETLQSLKNSRDE